MAICPKLAEGEVVRVTRLDACGAPVEGAGNAFVDECFATVTMAPNVEEGEDIDFRAMSGRSCGYKRGCPSFRGYDITATFFQASPDLIEIMTQNPVVDDFGGDPVGWRDETIECTGGFALEIWENVVGEDCPPGGGSGLFWYWLLPWISQGRLGDVEISQSGVTFELTGFTRVNSLWEKGPWDVVGQDGSCTPGPLLVDIGPNTHRHSELTCVSPPTAACATVLVPPNNT